MVPKKVPGTMYCTQWKKQTKVSRTEPYRADQNPTVESAGFEDELYSTLDNVFCHVACNDRFIQMIFYLMRKQHQI